MIKLEELSSKFNLEPQTFAQLIIGIRPAIRISCPGNINELAIFCKRQKLFILIKKMRNIFGSRLGCPMINAYISPSKEFVEKTYKAEINNNRILFGKLMGYPECCINKYIEQEKINKDKNILTLLNTNQKLSYYCNNLFTFHSKLRSGKNVALYSKNYLIFNKIRHYFLINYVPCSYSCGKSIEIGRKTMEFIKNKNIDLAKKIIKATKHPVLYFDYFNWLVLDGSVDDGLLKYNRPLSIKSLLSDRFINKFKKGNSLRATDKKIIIYRDKKIIEEIIKKDRYRGVIFDFK